MSVRGDVGRSLPVAPPDAPDGDRPLPRHLVDEVLCLARHFDSLGARSEVRCTGTWAFPVDYPVLLAA